MSIAKNTSIRMADQTRRKIQALIDAEHSTTMTGVIELAIDRMYHDELIHGHVQDVTKPKGWQLLPK